MPTTQEYLALISLLRAQRSSLEWSLIDLEARIAKQTKILAQLTREGLEGTADFVAAEALLLELQTQCETQRASDVDLLSQINAARSALASLSSEDPLTVVSSYSPLMLMPVRLETRFQRGEGEAPPKLMVRVFPDAIHVENFEQNLTDEELEWVENTYRVVYFDNPVNIELRRSIWEQGRTRMSPQRLAWALEVHDPSTVPQPPNVTPETLQFPSPQRRQSGWHRAARCRTLPDRWTFVVKRRGVVGERRVAGEPIPESLQVGPDPRAIATGGGETLPLDPGLKWMVDFEEACQVGMATTIELWENSDDAGVDVLVFGVKASARPLDGPVMLGQLFNAHQYGSELALEAAWTPTNSTETTSSGYASRTGIDYFATTFQPINQTEWETTDGYALAKALDIPLNQFRKTAGGHAFSGLDAEAMNTALWEATWGYFLDQMLAKSFTRDQIGYARELFIQFVRARGPFPTLRVGAVPYGVLPVTTLDGWEEPPHEGQADYQGFGQSLAEFLQEFKSVWDDSVDNVPRIGKAAGANNSTVLTEILGMQATTISLEARAVMGDQTMDGLWGSFPSLGDRGAENLHDTWRDFWWKRHQALEGGAITALNFTDYLSDPRLKYCTFAEAPFSVPQKWVDVTNDGLDTALSSDYISSLFDYDFGSDLLEGISSLTNAYPSDVQSQPVLYKLLRHAYLREYIKAATQKLIDDAENDEDDFYETEVVDTESGPQTPWQTLKQTIDDGLGGTPSLQEFCYDHRLQGSSFDSSLGALTGFYESLGRLRQRTVLQLEHLLKETLDLCAHRIDAWITSFATAKLQWLRAQRPEYGAYGAVIGGYGWLENVRASWNEETSETIAQETGDGMSPLYEPHLTDGYLHAPSLNQATAAAVLLSGHLANKSDETAIDLSSSRARTARSLLEGVRGGQTLEALLGSRFEQALHEQTTESLNLEQHIEPLRQAAPLNTNEEITFPNDAEAPYRCVDGLQLIDGVDDEASPVYQYVEDVEVEHADQADAIRLNIAQLSRDLDAVDDGVTAESVYQMIQNNVLRSRATLESVESGESPPPELTVLETPRSALLHSHRLMILFTDTPLFDSSWVHVHRDSSPPGSTDPDFMSRMEPRLNAWLGRALGASTHIRCDGTFTWPDHAPTTVTVTMRDLGLTPLNLLYLCDDEDTFPLELERLVQWTMWRVREPVVPSSAILSYTLERGVGWRADEMSMQDVVDIIRAFRRVFLRARALKPADLCLPDQSVPEITDEDELQDRADYLVANLAELQWQLTDVLLHPDSPADFYRDNLFEAALFAIPGAAPAVPVGDTDYIRAQLGEQVTRVLAEVNSRLERANALPANDSVARMRAALGNHFLVLPRFTPGNSDELAQAMAANGALAAQDVTVVPEWLLRVGGAHPDAAAFYQAFSFLESMATDPFPECRVLQLPYLGADDVWIGKEITEGNSNQSRLSILAHLPDANPIPPGTAPVSGLMIDAWNDLVPSPTENTGVAMHFNRPMAQTPQAILLAVAPAQSTTPWTEATLEQVLRDTFDLARYRMVDGEALEQVGQYLPAAFLASNLGSQTAATDFSSAS